MLIYAPKTPHIIDFPSRSRKDGPPPSLCLTNLSFFLTCFDRIIYSLQASERVREREEGGWSTACMRFPSGHDDNPPPAAKHFYFSQNPYFSFSIDGLARLVYWCVCVR
ncbi:hypothetical protein CIPAW_01G273700 [Carya illinoinensis]|uniref:Uncharacterized protein n=1 Tax=Carya illinoinensis TaxID=32201 RepID=A0A8T1RUC1_CARIL|nr:hypothetical protein CIPAW_01G273700 [Carya illinoinensis]